MSWIETAAIAIMVWNIIVFSLYGLDKHKAKRGRQRISERTLLLAAAFMGAPGAWFGMYTFRHKTKHFKFKVGVPLLLFIHIAVVAAIIYFLPIGTATI